MKTKVTVLGQTQEKKKELKKIEFCKWILEDGEWQSMEKNANKPYSWTNICLLFTDWRGSDYDLMIAYDEGKKNGMLVLGHFNDGIV